MPEEVVAARGWSRELVRTDNGPELIANELGELCRFSSAGTAFLEPGASWGGSSTSTTPRRCWSCWTSRVLAPDVNVLVYAHREELREHRDCKRWLEETVAADAAFGLLDLVLSGFLRVVTHVRVFKTPTPLDVALAFVDELRAQPSCVLVHPGARQWRIFERLCREAGAKGNLVADAYLAALAIESGCEWVTTDRDYGRFPGLRWRHPLD